MTMSSNRSHIYRPDANRFEMLATTLYGLEEILADEIHKLGGNSIRLGIKSVAFTGDKRLLYEANFGLRCAVRIIVPLKRFTARNEGEFYRQIKSVDWSVYFDTDSTLAVDAILKDSWLDNSLYAAQKTKDAVVDRIRADTGSRPSVDLERPDIRINVFIEGTQVTVSLDSSGVPLGKRGYRTQAGGAPLSEILAAGMILQSGWDTSTSFVDPFCGSGTIGIEAALIAANISPGLIGRDYGFTRFPDYNPDLFNEIKSAALEKVDKHRATRILCSDISKTACDIAQSNASRAGITDILEIRRSSFGKLTPPIEPGILLANPPYGERLDQAGLSDLYESIGDTLKEKYSGWKAYILTGNLQAAKKIGLRTSSKTKLYNGPIECRLLEYELYRGSRKPGKQIK